jgi:hypothetical protein
VALISATLPERRIARRIVTDHVLTAADRAKLHAAVLRLRVELGFPAGTPDEEVVRTWWPVITQ